MLRDCGITWVSLLIVLVVDYGFPEYLHICLAFRVNHLLLLGTRWNALFSLKKSFIGAVFYSTSVYMNNNLQEIVRPGKRRNTTSNL